MLIFCLPRSPQTREGWEGFPCTFECELYPPITLLFPPYLQLTDNGRFARVVFKREPTPKPFFKTGSWIYPNLHEEKSVGRVFECTLMFAVSCCCAKFFEFFETFRATRFFTTAKFFTAEFLNETK